MTSEVKTPDPLRDTIRDGARDASAARWWLLALHEVGKRADRLVA